jgi:hypothetical protein
MTNLTQDVHRNTKGDTRQINVGLVGYTAYQSGNTAYTCYKGAVMMVDIDDVDGYAQPMQSGITAATGDIFLGFAAEQVSITSADTANDTKRILIDQPDLVKIPIGSLAVTDMGDEIFATDDNTFGTATSGLAVGTLEYIDDEGSAWLNCRSHYGQVSANTA